jgi:hypothetical protein
MLSGSTVRLLGAALVLRGLYGVFGTVGLFIQIIVAGGAAFESLELWFYSAFDIAAAVTLVWAGLAIASRRPSRRRWVTIFALFSVFHEAFVVWHPRGAGDLVFSLLSLALFGMALAYLFATRNDPEFKSRLEGPPLERAPPEAHTVVAARIANGPDWHKALLDSLHGSGVPNPPRQRRLLLFLSFFGLLWVAGMVNRFLPEAVGPELEAPVSLVLGLVSIVVVGMPVARLRRRLAQINAKRAEESLKKAGAKRPIFYLRSFALDDVVGRPSILELLVNFQPFNPEQTMTAIIGRCGPVLAIGRPGEALPALGAARFYVTHELWQEKVADVATVSQLVVWVSGTTLGLQWEITHLLRSLPPEKLILWAHPHLLDLDANEREAEWSRFVDGFGALFPRPLPRRLGETRFFTFGPDFEPIAFGESRWSAGSAQSHALTALLQRKDVSPFDASHRARRRRIGRLALGVVAALAIGAGYLFWDYVRVAPPKPLAWDQLAKELIDAERTPDVLDALSDTVRALDGRVDGNWRNIPPGRLPALQAAAHDYLGVFMAAHDDWRVEQALYSRDLGDRKPMVAEMAVSPEHASTLLQTVSRVSAALDTVERNWTQIKTETAGWHFADRMRKLVAARRQLLDAEAGLLRLLIDSPQAWEPNTWLAQPGLRFNDDAILDRARAIARERDNAAAALAAALGSQT